jgi:hypothetical protein
MAENILTLSIPAGFRAVLNKVITRVNPVEILGKEKFHD